MQITDREGPEANSSIQLVLTLVCQPYVHTLSDALGLELTGEESIDLSNVVTHINSDSVARHNFEVVFSEAESKGLQGVIQGLWEKDTNMEDRRQFMKDQQLCSKQMYQICIATL